MPPGPRTRLFGFPQRSAGLPQVSANPRLPAIWIVLDFGGIAPASPHFSLSFVESILMGKLDTRKTALGQRPFRYLRKPPDWGHHTICSNLHAKGSSGINRFEVRGLKGRLCSSIRRGNPRAEC